MSLRKWGSVGEASPPPGGRGNRGRNPHHGRLSKVWSPRTAPRWHRDCCDDWNTYKRKQRKIQVMNGSNFFEAHYQNTRNSCWLPSQRPPTLRRKACVHCVCTSTACSKMNRVSTFPTNPEQRHQRQTLILLKSVDTFFLMLNVTSLVSSGLNQPAQYHDSMTDISNAVA